MKVFMLPSYQSRAPSTRMRVNKIADFFQKENQPVEVLPFDLSIEEKHKRNKNELRSLGLVLGMPTWMTRDL